MFFKNKNQDNYDELLDEYNEVVREYNKLSEGYDMLEERYNKLLSEHTKVKKQLKKWTENQHGRKTKIDESVILKATELKKQGYSNIRIGKELSMSEGTIRNIFKHLNS